MEKNNIIVLAIGIQGGGAETYLSELLPELQKINKKYTYHLFVAKIREKYYNNSMPNVIIHGISDNISNSNIKRIIYENISIIREVKKIKPVLCLCATETFSPLFRYQKIPVINVYHSALQFYMKPKVDESRIRLLYTNIMRKISMAITSKTIAVSHFERGEIGGRYPKNMMDKIVVVYHGVNQSNFYPPMSTCERGSSPFSFNYILCISDRHRHKKIDEMISIFSIMHKDESIKEHLVIIGRPKLKSVDEKIKVLIEENNLNEYVHLIEHIDNKELRQYYWHARLYWTHSSCESFGLTPLESMACGTPVFSVWSSSLPEIYGESAIFYNPYCLSREEIARRAVEVLNDDRILSEYSIKGITHSQKFQWREVAREYMTIIEKEIDAY